MPRSVIVPFCRMNPLGHQGGGMFPKGAPEPTMVSALLLSLV